MLLRRFPARVGKASCSFDLAPLRRGFFWYDGRRDGLLRGATASRVPNHPSMPNATVPYSAEPGEDDPLYIPPLLRREQGVSSGDITGPQDSTT